MLSPGQLLDQIRLWKQQCDQLQEALVRRENELGRVREHNNELARFTDYPVTRFAAFATANIGFGIYLFLHH